MPVAGGMLAGKYVRYGELGRVEVGGSLLHQFQELPERPNKKMRLLLSI